MPLLYFPRRLLFNDALCYVVTQVAATPMEVSPVKPAKKGLDFLFSLSIFMACLFALNMQEFVV